jgi:hypothetical protein
LAAKLIEVAKNNMPTLKSALPSTQPSNTSTPSQAQIKASEADKQKKIEELLILLSEDFQLSPDLVRPGEGYRRRYKGRSKESFSFIDSLPRKRTKIPELDELVDDLDGK